MRKTNWEFPVDPKGEKQFFIGNSQIQDRNEFRNWEFPCPLYPYGYKKDNLFWEFPQEKMSKLFGNPMSSWGGGTINFWNSPL